MFPPAVVRLAISYFYRLSQVGDNKISHQAFNTANKLLPENCQARSGKDIKIEILFTISELLKTGRVKLDQICRQCPFNNICTRQKQLSLF